MTEEMPISAFRPVRSSNQKARVTASISQAIVPKLAVNVTVILVHLIVRDSTDLRWARLPWTGVGGNDRPKLSRDLTHQTNTPFRAFLSNIDEYGSESSQETKNRARFVTHRKQCATSN